MGLLVFVDSVWFMVVSLFWWLFDFWVLVGFVAFGFPWFWCWLGRGFLGVRPCVWGFWWLDASDLICGVLVCRFWRLFEFVVFVALRFLWCYVGCSWFWLWFAVI